MSPQSKYWGDVSPLSHRDRRPWSGRLDLRSSNIRVSHANSESKDISRVISMWVVYILGLLGGQ